MKENVKNYVYLDKSAKQISRVRTLEPSSCP